MHSSSKNGLFDESRRMAQSSRAMKRIGILLAAVLCGFSAAAQQTNGGYTTIPSASTNVPGSPDQIYASLTNTLAAENSEPTETRELSLQECIDLTVK